MSYFQTKKQNKQVDEDAEWNEAAEAIGLFCFFIENEPACPYTNSAVYRSVYYIF